MKYSAHKCLVRLLVVGLVVCSGKGLFPQKKKRPVRQAPAGKAPPRATGGQFFGMQAGSRSATAVPFMAIQDVEKRVRGAFGKADGLVTYLKTVVADAGVRSDFLKVFVEQLPSFVQYVSFNQSSFMLEHPDIENDKKDIEIKFTFGKSLHRFDGITIDVNAENLPSTFKTPLNSAIEQEMKDVFGGTLQEKDSEKIGEFSLVTTPLSEFYLRSAILAKDLLVGQVDVEAYEALLVNYCFRFVQDPAHKKVRQLLKKISTEYDQVSKRKKELEGKQEAFFKDVEKPEGREEELAKRQEEIAKQSEDFSKAEEKGLYVLAKTMPKLFVDFARNIKMGGNTFDVYLGNVFATFMKIKNFKLDDDSKLEQDNVQGVIDGIASIIVRLAKDYSAAKGAFMVQDKKEKKTEAGESLIKTRERKVFDDAATKKRLLSQARKRLEGLLKRYQWYVQTRPLIVWALSAFDAGVLQKVVGITLDQLLRPLDQKIAAGSEEVDLAQFTVREWILPAAEGSGYEPFPDPYYLSMGG